MLKEKVFFVALSVAIAYLAVFLLFDLFYRLLFGIEGMGMGDAKLLAMIAAMTGWKGSVFSLVAGSVQGILVFTPILLWRNRKRKNGSRPSPFPADESPPPPPQTILRTEVPFGPMLALGALEFVLWGDVFIGAYVGIVDKIALLFEW